MYGLEERKVRGRRNAFLSCSVKIWEMDLSACVVRMMMEVSMRHIKGATSVEAQNADSKSVAIRPLRLFVLYFKVESSVTPGEPFNNCQLLLALVNRCRSTFIARNRDHISG